MPSSDYLQTVLGAAYERMDTLKDIYDAGWFFFVDPDYCTDASKAFLETQRLDLLGTSISMITLYLHEGGVIENIKAKFAKTDPWEAIQISDAIREVHQEMGLSSKVVLKILRYSMTGLAPGVGIPAMMEILGRERVNKRLEVSLPSNFAK
jgi:glutamyl/glutaminyl-tRNA synthetase